MLLPVTDVRPLRGNTVEQRGFDLKSLRMGRSDWKFWLTIGLVVAAAYLGAYWLFAPI